MKPTITLLSAFAALTLATTALAQATVTSDAAGLLGKRYAEATVGFVDAKQSGGDVFGAGADVNLPVAHNIDLGFGYTYSWLDDNNDIDASAVSASATSYFTEGSIKPFGTVSLGYVWADGDDNEIWGAQVGLEYNVNARLALVVSAGYDDDFESGDNSSWDATASAHYAFTPAIGARLSASLIEGGNVGYGLGVVLKF